jgi:hypothetical protein
MQCGFLPFHIPGHLLEEDFLKINNIKEVKKTGLDKI